MPSQLTIKTKILKKNLVKKAQMLGYKNIQNRSKKELEELLRDKSITVNHMFYQIENNTSENNYIAALIFWGIIIFAFLKSIYLWWYK